MKTKTTYRIVLTLVVCLGLLALSSCSNDKSSAGPQMTAADYSEAGWAKFADQDYSDAQNQFSRAVAKNADYVDAYLGAGWSSFYLRDLSSAEWSFTTGKGKVSDPDTLADFHAGYAIVCNDLSRYSQAIIECDATFAITQSYSFSRQSTINHTDLVVVKANAYFQLGGDTNLSVAAELLNDLLTGVNLDPDNASTWKVDGQTFSSFSEALVRALEKASDYAASN